uniref:Uncharacterized protein n=1 Tax=Oryza brachyantha TaxID=4533 RepID=J3MIC0_ORYBR
VVVPLLLLHPGAHHVGRRLVGAGGAPEQVLAVLPAGVGVLQLAVAAAVLGVGLRVRRHRVVPRHRPDAHVGPHHVVQVHQVLLR